MEKFCPACSRVYNDDAAVCEVDGERLVLLNEEPSLVGHVLDGKYTLLSKLGEGGMGSVYLAEQATMGREVAIKVLRREFSQNRTAIKRFLREARAASKLGHPNTITVYDFGQSNDGLLYLVMERLSGRPLADILDQDGALTPQRAAHIFGQICDSLAEAHKQGITHRDLKPENIFIEQKVGNDDFVKVLDFGIAKMQGDDATGQATATGMICGTPSYMSPEQAMGKDIDGRSDIYALGVLLYEMLTNEKPFEGDTPMEVMLKHINEPAPDIYQRTGVQVPHGVQLTIEKLLSKRAPDRPGDCQEAKRLLIAGLDTPLVGPILSTLDPALPKKRKNDTADRMQSLEKTGLSQAVTVRAKSDILQIPPKKKSKRTYIWFGVGAAVAGAVVALIVALSGGETPNDSRAVDPQASAPTSTPPANGADTPSVPRSKHGAAQQGARVDIPIPVEVPEREATPRPPEPDTQGADATDSAENQVADAALPAPVGDTSEDGNPNEVENAPLEEVAVAPAAEVIPTAPTRARVILELQSVPSGAQVFEGEALLGTTPLTFARDKDSGPVKLSLRLRGYRPLAVELGTVDDVTQRVELKRAPGLAKDPNAKDPNSPGFGGTF